MSYAQTAGHILLNGAHDAINGEKESLLAVHNGINGISANVNSLHNLPSPATDSPATPVSTAAPDVKTDMDYQEQESDVRHEPLPVKNIDYKDDPISDAPQDGTSIGTRMSSFLSFKPRLNIIFSFLPPLLSSQYHPSTPRVAFPTSRRPF
jgi:hypothetical protein